MCVYPALQTVAAEPQLVSLLLHLLQLLSELLDLLLQEEEVSDGGGLHNYPRLLLLATRQRAHVFAADLLLRQLDLDEGPDGGEEPPPGPVLHTVVLLDVLLDAADGQILDLQKSQT